MQIEKSLMVVCLATKKRRVMAHQRSNKGQIGHHLEAAVQWVKYSYILYTVKFYEMSGTCTIIVVSGNVFVLCIGVYLDRFTAASITCSLFSSQCSSTDYHEFVCSYDK